LANFFYLTLDTVGPSNPSISLEGGATYCAAQLITATIGCSDGDTTGYQMKIWGDVDTTYDADVQATEGASNWKTYNTTLQMKLSATDGLKTVYLKLRDAVWNTSSQTSDTITLDTAVPVVTISAGPDLNVISKQTGKNVCAFSFSVDSIFDEYKVKLVPATTSLNDAGTLILTTNGSTNMSGTAGDYAADTNINCTINALDFETAGASNGVQKIIKVFAKDKSGQWSV
jgi:hypothetical protein